MAHTEIATTCFCLGQMIDGIHIEYSLFIRVERGMKSMKSNLGLGLRYTFLYIFKARIYTFLIYIEFFFNICGVYAERDALTLDVKIETIYT